MTRSPDERVDDGALSRAQALADPSRARIHHLLTTADQPLTIAALARLTGLHRTAVGTHLGRLVSAGLAEREVSAPAGRGRPVTVFRAVAPDPYRELSRWLAEGVRTGVGARQLGRDVGARLADTDGDAIAALTLEASRLGFAPELRPRRKHGEFELVLHTCPFADLASVDPDTVCDVHLGLAEGITAHASDVVVHGLRRADPHRGGCRLSFSNVGADRRESSSGASD
jgi:predicted ArsR family transcriptional regulator